jgi:hypothetical protein
VRGLGLGRMSNGRLMRLPSVLLRNY